MIEYSKYIITEFKCDPEVNTLPFYLECVEILESRGFNINNL